MTENYSDLPKTPREAKLLKITKYFSGKPCRKGHVCPRWTVSSSCYQCWNEFRNAHYHTAEGKAKQYKYSAKYLATERGRANSRSSASVRRRTFKVPIPPWEREVVRQFYEGCPPGHHVDHIIPLRHDLVCGLHVIANLQYLPAQENIRKKNKLIPITLEACVCPLRLCAGS